MPSGSALPCCSVLRRLSHTHTHTHAHKSCIPPQTIVPMFLLDSVEKRYIITCSAWELLLIDVIRFVRFWMFFDLKPCVKMKEHSQLFLSAPSCTQSNCWCACYHKNDTIVPLYGEALIPALIWLNIILTDYLYYLPTNPHYILFCVLVRLSAIMLNFILGLFFKLILFFPFSNYCTCFHFNGLT